MCHSASPISPSAVSVGRMHAMHVSRLSPWRPGEGMLELPGPASLTRAPQFRLPLMAFFGFRLLLMVFLPFNRPGARMPRLARARRATAKSSSVTACYLLSPPRRYRAGARRRGTLRDTRPWRRRPRPELLGAQPPRDDLEPQRRRPPSASGTGPHGPARLPHLLRQPRSCGLLRRASCPFGSCFGPQFLLVRWPARPVEMVFEPGAD